MLVFLHLKLFLENVSLLQLLFDILIDDNVYDDSNNGNRAITPPKFPDNRPICLVTTNNDYHANGRPDSCRTLTTYYYNNDNDTEHQDFFNAYGEAAGLNGHEVFHENFTTFILDKGNTFFCVDVKP